MEFDGISVFDEERRDSENERSNDDTENEEEKNDEDEVNDIESSHLVSASLSNITQVSATVSDEFEKKIVTEFLVKGCGCYNKPCSF